MSRQVLLVTPRPQSMDDLRGRLAQLYQVNPHVEGLGELEELHVRSRSGDYVAVIEHFPQSSVRTIVADLMAANENDAVSAGYWVRMLNWGAANLMLAELLEAVDGWICAPETSVCMPGRRYAARVKADPMWDYLDMPL